MSRGDAPEYDHPNDGPSRYLPTHIREPSSANQTAITSSLDSSSIPEDPRTGSDNTPRERSSSPNSQFDPVRYVQQDGHATRWVSPDKVGLLRVKTEGDPLLKEQMFSLARRFETHMLEKWSGPDKVGLLKQEARQDSWFRQKLLETLNILDFQNLQRRKGQQVLQIPQIERPLSAPPTVTEQNSTQTEEGESQKQPESGEAGATFATEPVNSEPRQAELTPDRGDSHGDARQRRKSQSRTVSDVSEQPRPSTTSRHSTHLPENCSVIGEPSHYHPSPYTSARPSEARQPLSGAKSPEPSILGYRRLHSYTSFPSFPTGESSKKPVPEVGNEMHGSLPLYPMPLLSDNTDPPVCKVGGQPQTSISSSMRTNFCSGSSHGGESSATQSRSRHRGLPNGFLGGHPLSVPDASTHPPWGSSPRLSGAGAGSATQLLANEQERTHTSNEGASDYYSTYVRNRESGSPEPSLIREPVPPPAPDDPGPPGPPSDPPPPQPTQAPRVIEMYSQQISRCFWCQGAIEEAFYASLDLPRNTTAGEAPGTRPVKVWMRTDTRHPLGPFISTCPHCTSWFHYRCAEGYRAYTRRGGRELQCPECSSPWE
ncbi:hypothetical protein BJX64DRAFT_294875 [Aspergillus heterothallicus]